MSEAAAAGTAFTLKLGVPVPEVITREVHEVHRWLARELLGTRAKINFTDRRDTLYLTFEQIRDEPHVLVDILTAQLDDAPPDVLLIDLSANPYDFLREPLLLHLAEFALKVAAGGCVVGILLPAFPPDGVSLFWSRLAMGEFVGTIVVLANTGDPRILGVTPRRLASGFDRRWRNRREQMRDSARNRMRAHIYRRLGHFHVAAPNGDHCGRYFYDASLAVDELGILAEERVREFTKEGERHEIALVAHSAASPWLVRVVALVAQRLGMRMVDVTEMSRRHIRTQLQGRRGLLFTDFVNTGNTVRTIAQQLTAQGVALESDAISALGVFQSRHYESLGLHMHCIQHVSSPHEPSEVCVQCQLGYPHTSTDPERGEPLRIRAYDMWDVVLRGEWLPETYGPASRELLAQIPDLKKAFAEFGDWLAYKLDHALSFYGIDSEVVVAAPDEPAVLQLIQRLRTRYEERLVAVGLPREALDAAADPSTDVRELLASFNPEPVWARQLRHAAKRDVRIVLIDEFNESGRTAGAMARLVEALEARCAIYVPILNRNPGVVIDGVPTTVPLYEFPASASR